MHIVHTSFFVEFSLCSNTKHSAIFFKGAEPEVDTRCTASPRRLPGYCILRPQKYFYNSEKKACVAMGRGHCNDDPDLFITEDECKSACLKNAE